MTQHPTLSLSVDNINFEEKIRYRAVSTEQAVESGDSSWEDEDDIVDQPRNGKQFCQCK
jgi:hypothetical protein